MFYSCDATKKINSLDWKYLTQSLFQEIEINHMQQQPQRSEESGEGAVCSID